MKYHIIVEAAAIKDISYFKKHDKLVFERIKNLFEDLTQNPFSGIGKPEPLKFELAGYWSRRITREHRLIYRVKGSEIFVIKCRYHY